MGAELRRKWIAAASVLALDPTARVKCPNCEEDFLEVRDVPYDNEPGMFSRYLECSKCHTVEILDRLRRSPVKP